MSSLRPISGRLLELGDLDQLAPCARSVASAASNGRVGAEAGGEAHHADPHAAQRVGRRPAA